MSQLLDGLYAPITSEIGFLECPASTARDAYLAWMHPIQAERNVRVECREVGGDFATKIVSVLPLTTIERRRSLFLPTDSRWTAYFDNGWQGTDAYSTVSYLCQKVGCRGVRAVCVPHTFKKPGSGRFGATIFELYAATTTGCSFLNTKRSICAANDGGRWVFNATGEMLEFEEPRQYESGSVKDRFTPEMLARYLSRLGIEFFSADFYDVPHPAHLVAKEGPSAEGMKSHSLQDVQAEY